MRKAYTVMLEEKDYKRIVGLGKHLRDHDLKGEPTSEATQFYINRYLRDMAEQIAIQ